MIKEGDIILWGGYGDSRYLIVKIKIDDHDVYNNVVELELIGSSGKYFESLGNVIRGIREGWITIEKEPIVPRKSMVKHCI